MTDLLTHADLADRFLPVISQHVDVEKVKT
jgi:hypothetical protein